MQKGSLKFHHLQFQMINYSPLEGYISSEPLNILELCIIIAGINQITCSCLIFWSVNLQHGRFVDHDWIQISAAENMNYRPGNNNTDMCSIRPSYVLSIQNVDTTLIIIMLCDLLVTTVQCFTLDFTTCSPIV